MDKCSKMKYLLNQLHLMIVFDHRRFEKKASPIFKCQAVQEEFFIHCLTLEYVTYRSSQSVGNQLPTCACITARKNEDHNHTTAET